MSPPGNQVVVFLFQNQTLLFWSYSGGSSCIFRLDHCAWYSRLPTPKPSDKNSRQHPSPHDWEIDLFPSTVPWLEMNWKYSPFSKYFLQYRKTYETQRIKWLQRPNFMIVAMFSWYRWKKKKWHSSILAECWTTVLTKVRAINEGNGSSGSSPS